MSCPIAVSRQTICSLSVGSKAEGKEQYTQREAQYGIPRYSETDRFSWSAVSGVGIDEIDSALDESNVRRFSEFLSEYSKHSQFIVVTHRKGTMEAADILHGVTMEDSGVSRLVSVKFQEEGQQVEEGRMMRGTN